MEEASCAASSLGIGADCECLRRGAGSGGGRGRKCGARCWPSGSAGSGGWQHRRVGRVGSVRRGRIGAAAAAPRAGGGAFVVGTALCGRRGCLGPEGVSGTPAARHPRGGLGRAEAPEDAGLSCGRSAPRTQAPAPLRSRVDRPLPRRGGAIVRSEDGAASAPSQPPLPQGPSCDINAKSAWRRHPFAPCGTRQDPPPAQYSDARRAAIRNCPGRRAHPPRSRIAWSYRLRPVMLSVRAWPFSVHDVGVQVLTRRHCAGGHLQAGRYRSQAPKDADIQPCRPAATLCLGARDSPPPPSSPRTGQEAASGSASRASPAPPFESASHRSPSPRRGHQGPVRRRPLGHRRDLPAGRPVLALPAQVPRSRVPTSPSLRAPRQTRSQSSARGRGGRRRRSSRRRVGLSARISVWPSRGAARMQADFWRMRFRSILREGADANGLTRTLVPVARAPPAPP